jgi:hypothetical protein
VTLLFGSTNPSNPTPDTFRALQVDSAGAHVLSGTAGAVLARVGAELIRPSNTTAYDAGDAVGALTELPGCGSANGDGWVVGALLVTDKKSVTPRFRVHLYNASSPTLAADNAPFKQLYADAAKRVGSFDLPAMTTPADSTNSDLSRAQDDGLLEHAFVCGELSTSLWFALECLDALTPAASQKFTLTLFCQRP